MPKYSTSVEVIVEAKDPIDAEYHLRVWLSSLPPEHQPPGFDYFPPEVDEDDLFLDVEPEEGTDEITSEQLHHTKEGTDVR